LIYYFLSEMQEYLSLLNVVRYITFRTACASLTAFLICLLLGPWLITRLHAFEIGQFIRRDGPSTHQAKAGTPTMGGVLIIISIVVPTILWSDLTNLYVWVALGSLVMHGAIGFADDYLKVVRRRSLGLKAKQKLFFQFVTAALICGTLVWMQKIGLHSLRLSVPFFKQYTPELDLVLMGISTFIPFLLLTSLFLVFTSNAVNLTDGLDGLAAGLIVIAASALTVLTYVTGHAEIANYLDLIKNTYASEVTIFCGSIVGATLGFLWHNTHPARIFMGDVGSISLGGAIGTVAVLIKQELLIIFIGGIFVLEAISVILQVAGFRLSGKRLFLMAPIHHHFELKGWTESQVVVRFWILGLIFALFSLTTLKLR